MNSTERSIRNTMHIITHGPLGLTYLFFIITAEAPIGIAVRVITFKLSRLQLSVGHLTTQACFKTISYSRTPHWEKSLPRGKGCGARGEWDEWLTVFPHEEARVLGRREAILFES
jgi:hypothetical protein